MTAERRFAGIDVGGRRKGFHGALLIDSEPVRLWRAPTAQSAVERLVADEVTLVAVDSPRTPAPLGQKSRDGERDLVAAQVCNIRYTPDREGLDSNPSYYEWIDHGFELYAACTAAGIEAVECFPTASWSRWAGPRSSRTRGEWTSAALAAWELRGLPARLSQDDRDAVGAALTARAYADGETESFGDIVVPFALQRTVQGAVAQDDGGRDPLTVIALRYALGELSREQFLQLRDDLA